VKPNIYSSCTLMFSIQQYAWLVATQYKSTELAKSDWAVIKKSPPWAIDSWGMGM